MICIKAFNSAKIMLVFSTSTQLDAEVSFSPVSWGSNQFLPKTADSVNRSKASNTMNAPVSPLGMVDFLCSNKKRF